jgi:CubicO group peptidase (beta-lactamase class C family)
VAEGEGGFQAGLDRLTEELELWSVPGLELVVVREGEVVHLGGMGVRGVEDPAPIGAQTRFHHGSCGKAVTSLTATLLAEEGLLDLDAPVRRYVPELSLSDPVVTERITTRDLLSHRSGFSRHDLAWICNGSRSRDDFLARLTHLPMAADLRSKWLYSNFGYMLAGVAIGRAAGTDWEGVVASRLTGPLGMTRTTSVAREVLGDEDRAEPHLLRDGKAVSGAFRWVGAISAAGGLLSCASDSAPWLVAQTAAEDGPLPVAAVTATHQLEIPVPGAALSLPGLSFIGYGLGWVVGRFLDRPALWHNGGIDGFRTDTLLLPEQRIGILVSTNLHASALSLAAVLDLAARLVGQFHDADLYEQLRPKAHEPEAKAEPSATVEPASTHGTSPAHDLADYVGTYINLLYGDLEIGVEGDRLTVRLGEESLEATHLRYETWTVTFPALEASTTLTLHTGPDARVGEATLVLEDGAEPVVFRARADPAAEAA